MGFQIFMLILPNYLTIDMNINGSIVDKEVLEFDSQTDEEEVSANGEIYPYDPTKASGSRFVNSSILNPERLSC